MEKCPKCRTKYNPSYTLTCEKCGALLVDLAQPAQLVEAGRGAQFPRYEPSAIPSPGETDVLPPRKKVLGDYLTRAAPFAGWIIVGLFALSGVVWAAFTNADRDESGVIVDEGVVGVMEARVGDCVDLLEDDLEADVIFEFVGIPCSEPHSMEIFGLVAYSGITGDFPGEAVIDEFGWESCLGLFDDYVGAPYETEPTLDITYFTPEPEGWAQGDREVTCALVAVDGSGLVGSMKGMGQVHTRSLQPGCYQLPEDQDAVGMHPRPCEGIHDVEVFATGRDQSRADAPYDEVRLSEFGDGLCQAEYTKQLGAAASDPEFTWSYYFPSPESWADGDREFACFLMRVDQAPFTGSPAAGNAGSDV
ncbi:MAG TPA: septum formation family protein [Acidimicrobiia bacterium]|nr:septum formation family protein [Acidimicrobiia bacterium]